MKKILGLLTAFLLVGTIAMAQETVAVKTTTETVKKCCTPSAACAKAAGISLEECKKRCSKSTSTAATSETATAKLTANKSCAKSGAKKCCSKSKAMKNDAKTNSAPVRLVSNLEGEKTPAKKCCDKKKACTKKKALN